MELVPVPDSGQHAAASLADVMASASALLGRPLTDPVVLQAGSGRSVVLRGRAGRQAVVVKAYPGTGAGRSSFAAEAAGLELATGTGLTPAFLGAACDVLAVVMSDLGSAGSLADVLLGSSPLAARSALLNWADACGALAGAAGLRQAEFDAARARYLANHPDERYLAGLPDRILAAARVAGQLGVAAPAGLDGELADIAAAATSSRYAVFSPGDICPDNNMLTGEGIRFLDFESAGFHPAFLDAAYIRMPFSTCWCVFRLPAEVSAAAEAAYRSAACAVRPELADEDIWQPGVRRGIAAWTLSSMWWLLARAIEADEPMDPEQVSPRRRQLIRYRWRSLAAELDAAGELPAVAGLMHSLLAATEHWRAPDLPVYPAFR